MHIYLLINHLIIFTSPFAIRNSVKVIVLILIKFNLPTLNEEGSARAMPNSDTYDRISEVLSQKHLVD